MTRCEPGLRPIEIPSSVDFARRRLALTLPSLRGLSALSALGLLMPTVGQAQTVDPRARTFPPDTLRGRLQIGAFPAAVLNGVAVTLSPGTRIRQSDNMLALPQQIAGQDLTVHYRLEAATGQIREIWLLNAAELAITPWPTTPRQLQTWQQDPQTQRWTPAP
jgi:hypothetical protein